MRKGITIRTIMLISVGVFVVGILIYMVYKYASGSMISEADCNARITEACTVCKGVNWKKWPSTDCSVDPTWCEVNKKFFEMIWKCAAEYPKFSAFSGVGPAGCEDMKDPCKMLGVE